MRIHLNVCLCFGYDNGSESAASNLYAMLYCIIVKVVTLASYIIRKRYSNPVKET